MPPKGKEVVAEVAAVEEAPPDEVEEPLEVPEDEKTELDTGLVLPLRGVDVKKFWSLDGVDTQIKYLEDTLGLVAEYPTVSQRQIVAEFYLFNLTQAKILGMSPQQGAVFHAILASVLAMMRCPAAANANHGSPKDLPVKQVDSFDLFQRLLIQHSLCKPPESLKIFSLQEAKMVTDFATNTLFKHYMLYLFCINFEREVQTLRFCQGVAHPLPPPKLADARLRPRRKEEAHVEACTADVADAGGGDDVDSTNGEDLSPEDEEIRRLVEEKLRETEQVLQAKLDAREDAFRERLASRKK